MHGTDDEKDRVPIGERVTIYRRGKRGVWTAEFSQHDKHCRRSLRTSNKKVAIRKATQLDHELSCGMLKPPAPATMVMDAIQQYIEFLKIERRAAKTVVRYRGELNTFAAFCKGRGVHRLANVTPSLLDAYRAMRGKTHHPKTVFHESIVIKQLLRWSESRQLIAETPLKHYRVAKPISRPKPAPTSDEVQRILRAASLDRRMVFAVLAFTGMRVGELQNLRDEDVDRQRGWIQVASRPGAETKTKQSRKIPIHPLLLNLLRAYRRRTGPYFFSTEPSPKYPEGGHRVSPKHLNEAFQAIAKKLGMPVGRDSGYTLHALRRFFETFAVNAGTPQRAVDTWMGHRGDKSMGSIYYSLSDADSSAMMAKVPFSLEPARLAGEGSA
jgi:integrase